MAQKITFKIDGERYTIPSDPGSFTAAELNAVERNTGMTVGAWGEKLDSTEFSSMAWSALAWLAVRRAGKFIRWDDFEATLSVFDLVHGLEREDKPAAESGSDAAAEPTLTPVQNRADRRRKGTAATA